MCGLWFCACACHAMCCARVACRLSCVGVNSKMCSWTGGSVQTCCGTDSIPGGRFCYPAREGRNTLAGALTGIPNVAGLGLKIPLKNTTWSRLIFSETGAGDAHLVKYSSTRIFSLELCENTNREKRCVLWEVGKRLPIIGERLQTVAMGRTLCRIVP